MTSGGLSLLEEKIYTYIYIYVENSNLSKKVLMFKFNKLDLRPIDTSKLL